MKILIIKVKMKMIKIINLILKIKLKKMEIVKFKILILNK